MDKTKISKDSTLKVAAFELFIAYYLFLEVTIDNG